MDSISTMRGNGTGFLHLSRRLQPGESVPHMPSLADQLMACRLVREKQQEPEPDETVEDEI